MRFKLIYIFLVFCQLNYAQTINENLKKYWYYRERLRNNFILISSNYTEEGTNIPADRINGNQIDWDDGNSSLYHYISVLATEYRLLKNYNQEYSQTINELFYVLKSFERLDYNAEQYYRPGGEKYSTDFNGLYNRRDITYQFWDKYRKNGTNEFFGQEFTTREKILAPEHVFDHSFENSIDNTWHLIEAFALVNALVDNENVSGTQINFRQIAKDNVYRMVDIMIHNHLIHTIGWQINPPSWIKDDLAYKWYLENPATGNEVREGSGTDGTMHYVQFGLACAANKITGSNSFAPRSYSSPLFRNLLLIPLTGLKYQLNIYNRLIPIIFQGFIDVEFALNGPGFNFVVYDFVPEPPMYSTIDSWSTVLKEIDHDDYALRSLCATGNIYDADGTHPYNVLIQKQNESAVLKYEHLPLIWSVINNDFTKISEPDKAFVLSLLNVAPACGPNKYLEGGIIKARNFNWSTSSRLIWPENLQTGNNYGEYSGLDYMMLHNLYWLANHNNYSYPNNIDYDPNLISDNTVIANNQISCSKLIPGNKSLSFIAGNNIVLMPGFSFNAINGGSLSMNVYSQGELPPIIFKKQSLSDYPLCTNGLKSTKPNTKYSLNANNDDDTQISVFPNPCRDYIDITIQNDVIKTIEVLNLASLVIKKVDNLSSTSYTMNISGLQPGTFFIRITSQSMKTVLRKINKL